MCQTFSPFCLETLHLIGYYIVSRCSNLCIVLNNVHHAGWQMNYTQLLVRNNLEFGKRLQFWMASTLARWLHRGLLPDYVQC